MSTGMCEMCGEEFERTQPSKRYCCEAHRKAAEHGRYIERHPDKRPSHHRAYGQTQSLCGDCGATILRRQGQRGPIALRCQPCRDAHNRHLRMRPVCHCVICDHELPKGRRRYCETCAPRWKGKSGRCADCGMPIVKTGTYCGSCWAKRNQATSDASDFREIKMVHAEWRVSRGCAVCGVTVLRILDAHHVDPKTKEKNTKEIRTVEDLAAELSRCVCLCANHHRLVAHEQRSHKHLGIDDVIEVVRASYPETLPHLVIDSPMPPLNSTGAAACCGASFRTPPDSSDFRGRGL